MAFGRLKHLGGRRFHPAVGRKNNDLYPWYVWIIFEKL
jgi:hypothetical protein